jgi:hypothetical protein
LSSITDLQWIERKSVERISKTTGSGMLRQLQFSIHRLHFSRLVHPRLLGVWICKLVVWSMLLAHQVVLR